MSVFSRRFNYHWKCREQKKNFQTILVKIFWHFTLFHYRSKLSQVKRTLISSITNLFSELSQKLPKDVRLGILGNIGKFSNLVGDVERQTDIIFSCPILLDFFPFVPNILSVIVGLSVSSCLCIDFWEHYASLYFIERW